MKKLFDRTQKDIEEEQMLLNELKKIEARKKERDRKTQDLQKLISQADQVSEIKKKTDFCSTFKLTYSIFCNNSKAKHHRHQRVLANKTRKLTKRKCRTKCDRHVLILLSM